MELSTGRPLTAAKTGQGRWVAVLGSDTPELGDPLGEGRQAGKVEASHQLEGRPHPQT